MRYLIAGGAGFIGSHLCDNLISKGHHIVCLDNFITGSKKNIEHLIFNDNFQLIQSSITEDTYIPKVDGIFHLASPTDPVKVREYASLTLETNIVGTSILLNEAKNQNASFLFVSSVRVFDKAMTDYSYGKKVGEEICQAFINKNEDVKIARLSSIYGPRMPIDDGRVIPSFIRKAKANVPLVAYNDVDSFCYVEDAAEALYQAMISKNKGTFDITTGETVSIIDLANLIISLTDSKSEISVVNKRTERYLLIPDKDMLSNWQPKVSLQSGIKRMI
jgi:nucleoside-diphosphate-sugar epimerase